MSNLIPCPINEKDLCSDVLFDCLFDNDIYCEGERNTLVGFLNGGVATAKYTEGSNAVTIRFLERPINELDMERIEEWLGIIRDGVNKNLSSNYEKMMTNSEKMMTNISFHNNRHVCKVLFTYLIEE
jgi:hypothetical protein